MKKFRSLIFILVGIVVVGGTVYALTLFQSNAGPDPTLVVNEEVEKATDLNEPLENVGVNVAPTQEQKQGNTSTVSILPTPRVDLESTDPSSVNLASGGLQLVELFAFW